MSSSSKPPLWVLLPNVLIPQTLFEATGPIQRQQTFGGLPVTLQKALARQTVSFQSSKGLDPVEAWLQSYLDCSEPVKFDQYPPWAMVMPQSADLWANSFCRWWGSVGHIRVERDGVSFIPPEALSLSEDDLAAFWSVAEPVLSQAGWTVSTTNKHVLMDAKEPLLMEQASPWSVQNVRLTDYLPMNDECAAWRKMWLNLQVELNNAEFNIERERKGLHTLNCLWFWGGGHPWPVDGGIDELKSVAVEGVYQVKKVTSESDGLLARLLFWKECLSQMLSCSHEEQGRSKQATVYAIDFEGWGASQQVFEVLESEVLSPLKMAGLSFSWGLLGQQGWTALDYNWQSRFKFWKSKPDWSALIEPEDDTALTEEDLRSAWEEGLHDQNQIKNQWDHQ